MSESEEFKQSWEQAIEDSAQLRELVDRTKDVAAAMQGPVIEQAIAISAELARSSAFTIAHRDAIASFAKLETAAASQVIRDYQAFQESLALRLVPDFTKTIQLPDYSKMFANVARMEEIRDRVTKLLQTAVPNDAIKRLTLNPNVIGPVTQPLRDAAKAAVVELNLKPVKDMVDTASEAEDVILRLETGGGKERRLNSIDRDVALHR